MRVGIGVRYVATHHVSERRDGRLVWDGPVMVFQAGDGTRCYAFSIYPTSGGRPRIRAVLQTSEIDSPEKAVRAGLVELAASPGGEAG